MLAIIVEVAFGKRRRGSDGDGLRSAAQPEQRGQAPGPVTHVGPVDLSILPHPQPAQMAAPIPALDAVVDTSMGHKNATEADDSVGAGDGSQARPGWYPDPANEKPYRWWDGTGWTTHVD